MSDRDPKDLLRPLVGLSVYDKLVVTLDSSMEWKLRLVDTRGEHYGNSTAARRDFPDRFPQCHVVNEGKVFVVPVTDISATVIDALWPKEQIEFDEEAKLLFDYHLAVAKQQTASMVRTAKYHEWCVLRDTEKRAGLAVTEPQFVDDFTFAGELHPSVHQRVGRANCNHTDGYGLFMEQGTGKTGCVIGRVDAESPDPALGKQLYRVIIVAPKNVRQNWYNEFDRFSTVEGRVIVLRGGDALQRRTDLLQGCVPQTPTQEYVVFVMSYECLVNTLETILIIPWNLAVLDESHFIKWPRTKRAKAAFQLRDVSKARMCLTGTPVCNTPVDLFGQLEFMREGGSGFSNFEAFRRFYGVFKITDPGRGIKRLVDVQNLPFMRERLARMCFAVRKDEALPDLPSKMYDIKEVEMSKQQAEIYKAIQDQLYYEIQSDLDDTSKTMNPQNILTKLLRLAQITSGFLTLDPVVDLESGEQVAPKVIEAIDPNPKLERLITLLKNGVPEDSDDYDPDDGRYVENEDSKVIIAATWVWDLFTIQRRLEDEGFEHVLFYGGTKDWDREEAVRRFNDDPTCRIFLVNAAAGGVGLNLLGYDYWNNPKPLRTTNCDHVVFYSQSWSHPQRAQLEDRPHRTGSRVGVRYTDLVVPGTIDEEIRARVVNKKRMALEVQDLRSVLARVLGRDVNVTEKETL
jgi:hypothetical protein